MITWYQSNPVGKKCVNRGNGDENEKHKNAALRWIEEFVKAPKSPEEVEVEAVFGFHTDLSENNILFWGQVFVWTGYPFSSCEEGINPLGITEVQLLPNSIFAKLPSPAIDWKIWKALYLGSCSLFVRRNAGHNRLIPL